MNIGENAEKLQLRQEIADNAKLELQRSVEEMEKFTWSQLEKGLTDKVVLPQREIHQQSSELNHLSQILYQTVSHWNNEYNRFAVQNRELDTLPMWANQMEDSMHQVARKLEYICSELNRDRGKQ